MSFAVQSSLKQSFHYGGYGSKKNRGEDPVGKEFAGSATSRTASSDKGKNIGVMTIGNRGFIAKYADSSTEAEPVIKVGDYEVRVNDVDPKNATEIEMFALTSYMDDKGLTDNTGMKSFNRMRAYSMQAEYNGFCSGIADEDAAWTVNKDWTAILANAKESYYKMPQSYQNGFNCERLISAFSGWSQESQDNKSIGEYSEKEWDKLLDGVDEKIEELKEAVSEDVEKATEVTEKQNIEADILTARYTTYLYKNQVADPDSSTGEVIKSGYIDRTFYTKDGIISTRTGHNTKEGTVTDKYSWEVDFNSEDDYERTMKFLDRIPEGDNTVFTTRENFWQDFVNGEIDEDEFFEFYDTLDHGVANFIKTDENGNNYIDKEMMSSKYFKYFGLQQVKTVPWEDLQRGLELSALKDRGFDHYAEYRKEEVKLYDSLKEAFSVKDNEGFRFYGEEDVYSLDEWLQEIIRRAHMGLMDLLFAA